MPFASSLPCRDNGPLRAHICIEEGFGVVWAKVRGPVHPWWPVQPPPGDHHGKVGMNMTTPGDKKGTP